MSIISYLTLSHEVVTTNTWEINFHLTLYSKARFIQYPKLDSNKIKCLTFEHKQARTWNFVVSIGLNFKVSIYSQSFI